MDIPLTSKVIKMSLLSNAVWMMTFASSGLLFLLFFSSRFERSREDRNFGNMEFATLNPRGY
jgi:hypothetical protein